MIGRTLSVAGIVAGIGTVLSFLRAQGIVTTAGLLWALIIIGAALVAWLVSWGYTQFYKTANVPPAAAILDKSHVALWHQRIYKRAVFSGFIVSCIEGVILLLSAADPKHMAVYAVMWFIGAALVGFSSPFLWKVVFEIGLPWLLNASPTLGVEIRRNPVTGTVDAIKDHTQPDAKTELLGRSNKPQEE